MKCLLSVCLAVLTTEAAIFAVGGREQALQKGVSVEMATSSHATVVPEADTQDAWIVTVVRDGSIFFGTEELSPEGLTEKMTATPRNRDAKLYVKADASVSFSSVRQVLHAARTDLFDDVMLLTSQPGVAQPGTVVPPKGLDLWIGSEVAPHPITVQISSEQESALLKINNEAVAPADLQGHLGRLFDNRAGRIVVLKASGQVPYAQVVHAIDACRGAGASRISMTVSPEI